MTNEYVHVNLVREHAFLQSNMTSSIFFACELFSFLWYIDSWLIRVPRGTIILSFIENTTKERSRQTITIYFSFVLEVLPIWYFLKKEKKYYEDEINESINIQFHLTSYYFFSILFFLLDRRYKHLPQLFLQCLINSKKQLKKVFKPKTSGTILLANSTLKMQQPSCQPLVSMATVTTRNTSN